MSDLFVILGLRISHVHQYTPDFQSCECLNLGHYDPDTEFMDGHYLGLNTCNLQSFLVIDYVFCFVPFFFNCRRRRFSSTAAVRKVADYERFPVKLHKSWIGQQTLNNTDVIYVLAQTSLLSIWHNIFINRHYQSRNYNTLFGLFVISLWYNLPSRQFFNCMLAAGVFNIQSFLILY